MRIFFSIIITVFFFITPRTFSANSQPDSLSYLLYDAIFSVKDTTESVAINHVKKLLNQGANPNKILNIASYSPKLSTFPIIKEFYNGKYRVYHLFTTPVHAATATGNLKIMQLLLDHGGNPDVPDGNKFLPINLALSMEDTTMTNFLLSHGSSISKIDLQYSTDTSVITTYVKKGANPETIDINYALNDTTVLKKLFTLGALPNTHLLNFEIIIKKPGLFDFLLANGFDVNSYGKSPNNGPFIFSIIKYGNLSILKKAVEHKINLFVEYSFFSGGTPLILAISEEKTDIMDYLIEKGCMINETDWTKEPPLFKAITTDNDTLIKKLIDYGADIEFVSHFGRTPLMYAVDREKYIATKTLIKKGANINASDNFYETPLIIAIKRKNLPIIKLLIKNGAETNITYQSKDLVNFAKSVECSPEIIEYLENLK